MQAHLQFEDRLYGTLLGLVLAIVAALPVAADTYPSERVSIETTVIADGVERPTDMEFLPDGTALVAARRAGMIYRLDLQSGALTPLDGIPENFHEGDAGMHNIALHPDFADNGWLYLAYSIGSEIRSTIVVDRAKLNGNRLVDVERLFAADAWSDSTWHNGGRLEFVDEYLFVTIGDRSRRDRSQDRANHTGSIVRLHDDGRVPADNPFVGEKDVRPEIWSYGHRNPQGLVWDPATETLWSHEHGPRGGDELNRIERGSNYGWPVTSWGFEYDGGPIGMGIVAKENVTAPTWVWTPSIGPSGLLVYRGSEFPEWQGNLLVGSMAYVHLNRLVVRDGQIINEERLLPGALGRIRFVAEGPTGAIFLGSDTGQIIKLTRKDESAMASEARAN
ncbi:MAG: PQQ-dependent sugar dehydrogenase [Pseudomonadota bacterium]